MKKHKKVTKNGLDIKTYTDKWSGIKTDLEALAREQVQADIALVESTRSLKLAQELQTKAIARKTLAEKRLSNARSNLGGE